jgi:hypothetical protein
MADADAGYVPVTPAREDRYAPDGPACADAAKELGVATRDVFLNTDVFWRNIPDAMWDFHIGGYQVLKKWLSYREDTVLGRDLTLDEARHITRTARRLAAIRLTAPELDANYGACVAAAVPLGSASSQ